MIYNGTPHRNVRSMEGIFLVIDEFLKLSGLQIGMKKTAMYLDGVTESVEQEMARRR